MRLVILLFGLLACAAANAQTFFVATNGTDDLPGGTTGDPWATITFALDNVPDGALILVRQGTYNGRIRIRGNFANGVTVRSEVPYRAVLRHTSTVLTVFNDNADIAGITIEGFDVAHAGAGSLPVVVQIQDGATTNTSRVTLRNNILHDSFDNDILKVNNGASDITVVGNVFYNQAGSDEHIDANSVDGVLIEGNVFFNDFAASGRAVMNETSSYIVVKDSNAMADEYLGARNVTIRCNVFLNWQGNAGANFVLFGEDGTSNYEAFDGLVENNLMLGNSATTMRASFGVKGSRDITFRSNTVVGNLPSNAFAMRLNQEPGNQVVENIRFFNNVWSDPTGTMLDFSDTPPAELGAFTLANNGYWNGGTALPEDGTDDVNPSDDASATIGDPQLPSNAAATTPYWIPASGVFNGGATTIEEAFDALVAAFGVPGATSVLLDEGLAVEMPADDITGLPRGAPPYDLGAFETVPPVEVPIFADGFE